MCPYHFLQKDATSPQVGSFPRGHPVFVFSPSKWIMDGHSPALGARSFTDLVQVIKEIPKVMEAKNGGKKPQDFELREELLKRQN